MSFYDPVYVGKFLRKIRGTVCFLEKNISTREYVEELRRCVPWKISIFSWVCNDAASMMFAEKSGCDGIVSDKDFVFM